MKILVTGANGFIGPKIVHALRAEDRDVRALVRRPERAGALAAWGVELVAGDVTDAASMSAAAEGCTHVVHLVAIIQGRPEEFQRVMIDGTRNVIAAAKSAGVERFVLMSALGTTEETKDVVPYYNAKWTEEQDVIASEDLVAIRLVVSATHTGNMLGVPATGRPVQWDAVDIYRVTDDGKISEQWAFEDLAAILSQVGAVSLPWAG